MRISTINQKKTRGRSLQLENLKLHISLAILNTREIRVTVTGSDKLNRLTKTQQQEVVKNA